MKVIKSISIEQGLFDWLVENRVDFKKNFSSATIKILEASAGPSFSARDAEAKRIARRLAELNRSMEQETLEKNGLLQQMKFLEGKDGKKKAK